MVETVTIVIMLTDRIMKSMILRCHRRYSLALVPRGPLHSTQWPLPSLRCYPCGLGQGYTVNCLTQSVTPVTSSTLTLSFSTLHADGCSAWLARCGWQRHMWHLTEPHLCYVTRSPGARTCFLVTTRWISGCWKRGLLIECLLRPGHLSPP
jgi:hypothetical protein